MIAATVALADLGIRHGCHVTLTDRVSDGQRAVSATAPAVVVGDRGPVISSVVIDDVSPATSDTVHAVVAASDADGDPLSFAYQWMVNGVPVAGGTDAGLDLGQAGHGDRGDQVSVAVTASDGIATTGSTSAPATITNSAPVLRRATIDYDPPTATVTVNPDAVDADGDSLQTSVRWTINGFDAGTFATLGAVWEGFDVGDVIGARVRVTDTQGASSGWVAADPVAISSGAPPAPPMNDWYPYTELNGSPVEGILQVRSDPARLYVLDEFGFVSSSDSGATWSAADGPCPADASAAAYAPSAPDVVYAGCAAQGAYRSDDGGATWHAIPIVSGAVTEGVAALAVPPDDPDTVFAVCGGCGGSGAPWTAARPGRTSRGCP